MLGTSQGALREALRILEQKGLVEARLGRNGGLYVRNVTSAQIRESLGLMIRQKQISMEHLVVFRNNLEVSAASLAVIKAGPEEIDAFKKLLDEAAKHVADGVRGWTRFYQIEDRMHRTLASTTGNPLF